MLAAPTFSSPQVIAAIGFPRCRWKILLALLYTCELPSESVSVEAESAAMTMPSKTFTTTAIVTRRHRSSGLTPSLGYPQGHLFRRPALGLGASRWPSAQAELANLKFWG